MKFLKKLSTGLILTFGTISMVSILGVGAVGIHYKKEAVDLYRKIQEEMNKEQNQNIFSDINGFIKELDQNVKTGIVEVDKLLVEAKTKTKELDDTIIKLESVVNNGTLPTLPIPFASVDINGAKEDLKKVIADLKTTKKTLDDAIVSIDGFMNGENGKEGVIKTIEDFFAPGGPSEQVQGFVNDAEKIFKNIAETLSTTSADDFEKYYSTVATALVAIPAVILGLGLIGTIFGMIFYKTVDGKVVRRTNTEKELKAHIKKIVKKYPDILKDIK